jgi:hypothetical protein
VSGREKVKRIFLCEELKLERKAFLDKKETKEFFPCYRHILLATLLKVNSIVFFPFLIAKLGNRKNHLN